jgi:hypothetical protein
MQTEETEPFAANPSERLPVAYTGGAESTEVFNIGFLSDRHAAAVQPQHAENRKWNID